MSKRSAEARLSELREAFLEADENLDGALDRNEFKQFGLQMFKKPCPLAVYKGMCEYCGKTIEQGLSWEDIKKLFLDSNVNVRRRRDPSRQSSQEPPSYYRDFSPRPSAQRFAHSRTQSLSSTFSSNSTFRRDSESSSYHIRGNPLLGYIDERSATYSSSLSFEYPDHTRPRHYVSKSLNNVADFYDDRHSSQIQNELVKILQHKFNKAQSRLTDLDKKEAELQLRRLKETDDRREAEQTFRKLEKELKDRESLLKLTYVRGREAQEVSLEDVEQVKQELNLFQGEHENLMLDLSRKQKHVPILKEEISLLDHENALLRELCENLGIADI